MPLPQESENKPKNLEEGHTSPAPDVPPPPPQDPRYGDKTPAYVEYMFKFFPDQAKQLYGGRKVMGKLLPPVISDVPNFERKPLPPLEGDLSTDAMETEPDEVWMRK